MSRRRRNESPISLFSFQDIVTSVTAVIILMTLLLALELINRTLAAAAAPQLVSSAEVRQAIEEAQQHAEKLRERLRQSGEELQQTAGTSPTALKRELREVQSQHDSLVAELNQLRRKQTAAKRAENEALAQKFDREAEQKELDDLNAARKLLAESVAKQQQSNKEKLANIEEMKHDAGAKSKGRRIYNPAAGAAKQAWLVEVSGDVLVAAPLGRDSKPVTFKQQSISQRVEAFSTWTRQRSIAKDYFVGLVRPSGIESFDALRDVIDARGFDMRYDLIGESEVVLDAQHGAGNP